MSDVEVIIQKLRALGLEDTKRVSEAALNHLDDLDDEAVYDAAKANAENAEPLELVLKRYPETA